MSIRKALANNFSTEDNPFATRFEKMPVMITNSIHEGSLYTAQRIASIIRTKQTEGKNAVIGLSTRSSPLGVYQELIRMHREEHLSFHNVITFNLDEYYPIVPYHQESFTYYMWDRLFNHIDIKPANVYIPKGTLKQDEIASFCADYDRKIAESGGLDFLLLSIGRTGHLGFNEPGSTINSKTRLITLASQTRTDASNAFNGEENVPRHGITMGMRSILGAKEIVLLAWGEAKADITRKAIEGTVTDMIPATLLQNHHNALFVIDQWAASELSRFKTPWLTGSCIWDPRLIRKAIIWLCSQVHKPVLKLTLKDYNDHGLGDLISNHGPFSKLNIDVFNDLQHTITGWPGGKPNVDDATRPERALPYPKKSVIFSPHPDDDVISMGGTFARLVKQGHQVHVAYQTSGSIAVSDDDALRYIDFVQNYERIFASDSLKARENYHKIRKFYKDRDKKTIEPTELLSIKAAIRRGEAKASCRYIGLPEENIHFLNYPFYETGTVKKAPAGEADIKITIDFLRNLKPHQIYAAGDLSDPHGTHRVCIDILLEALNRMKDEEWMKDCRVWLYRGAWQEWEIDLVDMAVPLSPEEVEIKRNAIYKHQSQKDGAMFMGEDKREFWKRAEDRNKQTALLYDKLGMAEYEAIEVFVRYDEG